MKYLLNLAIAIDQLANAILDGDADETLSARAYRMQQRKQPFWGWTAPAIDLLFFWQKEHCKQAYETELKRKIPSA